MMEKKKPTNNYLSVNLALSQWIHKLVIITGINTINVYVNSHSVWTGLERPGQTPRIPGSSGSKISRQLTHEGGKDVSPMQRMPLQPVNVSGSDFC
jgi:hypothetical protein